MFSKPYRAPECVLNLPARGGHDIWAAGVVLLQMVNGHHDSVFNLVSRPSFGLDGPNFFDPVYIHLTG